MTTNHRKNVWITPETHAQLIAIGRAHGAAEGREASPGIRVAAKYHSRLVKVLADYRQSIEEAHRARLGCGNLGQALAKQEVLEREADALLKEIEEAR